MASFWIADGEFSGQAAEDLQALYDDMHDRDWDSAYEAEGRADDPKGETADPFDDEQEWTREQVTHACGHTVGYSTPATWPAKPVDASKFCGECRASQLCNPFSGEGVME